MEASRVQRTAHEQAKTEGPVIEDKLSKVPLVLRQHALDKFFELMCQSRPKCEARKEAYRLELELYEGSKKKAVYKNNLLAKLKSLTSPKPDISKVITLRFDEVKDRFDELLVPADLMEQIGFPCNARSQREERLPEQEKFCSQCKKSFVPGVYYAMEDPEECKFHWGKLESVKRQPVRLYSCCGLEPGSVPCSTSPRHVYRNKSYCSDDLLVSTLGLEWPLRFSQCHLVALDGEMLHTTAGLELCRLTIVDWDETRILDVIIKPQNPVIDYNTRFSGISAETFLDGGFKTVVPPGFEPRAFTFDELQTELIPFLIGPETILLGHSLENDLFYMKLDHKRIIDTSVLYPHNKGQPYRMSLKDLARVHLKQFVQQDSSGHDSYEDCVACLRLLKLKL